MSPRLFYWIITACTAWTAIMLTLSLIMERKGRK